MPDSTDIELNPDIVRMLHENLPVTPVMMRKVFLLLTRSHFSTPGNYGQLATKFKDFVWDNTKAPKLFIDLDYNYDPKDMDRRPAIFVGCSDFVYEQVMLDGRVAETPDNAGTEYHNRGQTQIIIRHVGKTPDESLELGNLSAQFFRGLRKAMKRQIGFTQYVVARLAATRVFEKEAVQADKHFNADLVINLAFNANWMIFTESHRLKTWTFEQMVNFTGNSEVNWGTQPVAAKLAE